MEDAAVSSDAILKMTDPALLRKRRIEYLREHIPKLEEELRNLEMTADNEDEEDEGDDNDDDDDDDNDNDDVGNADFSLVGAKNMQGISN